MSVKYKTYVISNTNYKLVSLNHIFAYSHIEYIKLIHKDSITNKSVCRKIFYHTYIHNICKAVIDNNKNFIPILIFDESCADINNEEHKLFRKFTNMFPILNIVISLNFEKFVNSLCNDGMREEIINNIICNQDKLSCKKFYFSKIQQFCKRNELTFLDKKFFGDIKNKMLLI